VDADPNQAAVLRISLPMGPSFNRHAGAIDWIDSRLPPRPALQRSTSTRSVSCTYTGRPEPRLRSASWRVAKAACITRGGARAPVTLVPDRADRQIASAAYDPALLHGLPARAEAGPVAAAARGHNVSLCSDKLAALFGGKTRFQKPWPLADDVVSDRPALGTHDRPVGEKRGGVLRRNPRAPVPLNPEVVIAGGPVVKSPDAPFRLDAAQPVVTHGTRVVSSSQTSTNAACDGSSPCHDFSSSPRGVCVTYRKPATALTVRG